MLLQNLCMCLALMMPSQMCKLPMPCKLMQPHSITDPGATCQMCQIALLLCPGGAGPLVICSDCYDNANIYSRTREYCPYSYLEEDDPLDRTLPGLRESFSEHAQHQDSTLESIISNHDPSVFLTSHDKRLSIHTPPEHCAKGWFYPLEQDGGTFLPTYREKM